MNRIIRFDGGGCFDPQTGQFITCPEPPVVRLFTTDRNILDDETPATVRWIVENATYILLNNEAVAPVGTRTFHANNPLAIVLTASNMSDEPISQTLHIDVNRQPPVIRFFKVSEPFAVKGSPVTLSWEVEQAHTIEIDNGIGDVTQMTRKTITLGNNGVFRLTARSFFGASAAAEALVMLFPVPIITGLFIPRPRLNIKAIANNQPVFNLEANIHANIRVRKPVFTDLDKLGTKLRFRHKFARSVLFPNNIFKILTDKQKEISHIAKSIWKNKLRKRIKRMLGGA